MKSKKKRGQMNLSFGMIFSIILIIAFIAFAFYGITKFLEFQETVKVEQFVSDLQADVDNVWRGTQASQPKEYSLPNKIEQVCFRNDEYENMYFESETFKEGKKIQHIDMEKTLDGENNLCLDNVKEKVNLVLEKKFGEILVTITKSE